MKGQYKATITISFDVSKDDLTSISAELTGALAEKYKLIDGVTGITINTEELTTWQN